MRRYLSPRLFLGLIFMVSVLIITVTALYVSRRATSQTAPTVINETEALQVESLTTEVADPQLGGTRYILNLKNVSDKKVIRFAIEQPDGGVTSVDYTTGVGALLPGAIEMIDIADYSETQPGTAQSQPKRIIIRLAMFEDGSSEGDFKTHQRFANRYFGRKTQLKQINVILKESLTSSKDLRQIASEISALPDVAQPGEDKEIGEGYVEAKQTTIHLLNSLIEWQTTSKNNPNAARGVLARSSADLVGVSRPEDGITRIVNSNQKLIERSGNR